MEKKISAPFSPDQVQVLNKRQCHVDGGVAIHPFTCPNRNEGVTYDRIRSVADDTLATHGLEGGDRGLLIATPGGWVCPHCTYTQSWAYASMAIRPTPVAELFRNHPTLVKIFGRPRLDHLEEILAEYKRLAASGRIGADTMVACLDERRRELLTSASRMAEGSCS